MAYLRRLLSPAERKNSWPVAEVSGNAMRYGSQHLLGGALWDLDAVRGELRRYVVQQLGDADAVLVIDETGLLKKGSTRLAWPGNPVARRGGLRTARSASFWVMPGGWARRCWTVNSICPESGPRSVSPVGRRAFPRTAASPPSPSCLKPCCNVPSGLACTPEGGTADRVYGDDRRLRMWLESQPQAYGLAVSGQE
jgi:DDE superfamily endonuclease